MEMGAHHHVDLLRADAGLGEAGEIPRLHAVPFWARWPFLVIADTGVDQHRAAADAQEPAVDAELQAVLRGIEMVGTIEERCAATASGRQSGKKAGASQP